MQLTKESLSALKIIPVVTPYSVEKTVKMTEVMLKGGIRSVEITLRTDCAFDAIEAVKAENLGVSVGVGTITSADHVERIAKLGCDYMVTPGITPAVLSAAKDSGIPLLPGISGPSELMLGLEYGYEFFKLFPASVVNAIPMLKALGGPFPDVHFCPTGGVSPTNAREHLDLKNVVCVGGSWMMPKAAIDAGDWDEVTRLSAEAMKI